MTRARKQSWIPPRTPEERAAAVAEIQQRWPHPVGTPVRYYSMRRRGRLEGDTLDTTTRTKAFRDVNGEVVIFLHGKAGYVLCSHLEVRCLEESSA